jgi:hypothetical protein
MKAFNIVIVLLVVVSIVFYFTKPTDDICIEKAKSNIDGAQYSSSVPGYDNPMTDNSKAPIGKEISLRFSSPENLYAVLRNP